MGCATSRIDDSDVLIQCKQRKRLMKDAMNFRQDFAIAHLAYIETLRNVGIALRHFSEGEISDTHTSPRSPAVPVLSLPQTSSPPVAALSPPPAAVAAPLSPPLPSPSPSPAPPPPPPPAPQKAASPPSPSSPASSSPPSPPPPSTPRDSNPASPFSELRPPPPLAPDVSPYADYSRSMSMPALYMGNGIASPERASNFFSPVYSPEREDGDEFYAAFSPPPSHIYQDSPPPPSPPPGSDSFLWDIFNPPPIPYHLQEQRRMKQIGEVEEEEAHDLDQVREEEGIPDLEEEEQKDEGKEQVEQVGDIHGPEANELESVADKSEKKVAEDSESASENSSDNAAQEVEKSVVTTVEKEVDVESERKGKEKKELAVLPTLKGSDLTEVVRHIDDHFARAYDSGKDVSGMLETQMVYHHLSMSILELKDSSKVFNAITWYWSRKTSLAMRDAYEDNDVQECGMAGSHAATLERLYAWEKKLYDEVKAEELIRMAFDRKRKLLSNLDAKGEDPNLIDKTRAALKKLDTRLMVALHAVQSASMRIQQLTNDELYPQLTELLGGLMNMWKVMFECHNTQKAIALEMQTLENSLAGDEASETHRKATVELEQELEKWKDHFHRWISSQKKYINVLSSWLNLCDSVAPTQVKGRAVSPSWSSGGPPIFLLMKNWHGSLELLEKEKDAADVISDFATVVGGLEMTQTNELNLKRQADKYEKTLDRKSQRYGEALDYSNDKEGMIDLHSTVKNSLQERRDSLNELRVIMENERQKHSLAVQDRRDRTLGSFKENLPVVFESMAKFAAAALDLYEKLQQDTEHCKCPPKENGDMHQMLE